MTEGKCTQDEVSGTVPPVHGALIPCGYMTLIRSIFSKSGCVRVLESPNL